MNNKYSSLKTLSSRRWIQRNEKDMFVKLSKMEGYRSRSIYKLKEINEKFHILKNCHNILDLGSSPGGWAELLSEIVYSKKTNSCILAVDLLKMQKLPGINFLKGNFLDEDIKKKITKFFDMKNLELILSDIAPNFTGNKNIDHSKMANMFENILEFGLQNLSLKGSLVAKIFHSTLNKELLSILHKNFFKVKYFKPQSSRKESSEIYLLALKKII